MQLASLRRFLSDSYVFAVAFTVLALLTIVIHARNPLSSGLDFHYHLTNAAINGRASGELVARLYRPINPLDANTLLYSIAYPFEKVTNPLRAFQIACTIAYYVGYPLGCAYALRRVGRSPWGALLAFPVCYGLTSISGGFWPFLTSSALMAPALAEIEVLHRSTGRAAWRAGIACAVFCALSFLGHAMVYGWTALMLALHTVVVMGFKFGRDGVFAPLHGLRRAFWVGLKSLAVIAPSACLVIAWYWRVMFGGAKAAAGLNLPKPVEPPMASKLFDTLHYLAPTRGEHEYLYLALLVIVVLGALVYGERSQRRAAPVAFERTFLVTALSFVVFPVWFEFEPTAPRQFDLAVLLLPLVLFPSAPRWPNRASLAAAVLFVFCVLRVLYVGEQLSILNRVDLAGLREGAEICHNTIRRDRAYKMAYVDGQTVSVAFKSSPTVQSHETFASLCGLETPVYDTQIYPHNLLPLRYVSTISAPVTIIEHPYRWWTHPNLWTNFDYVLLHGVQMSPSDRAQVGALAKLVVKSGQYELWERLENR
jgi:hypothetical protein